MKENLEIGISPVRGQVASISRMIPVGAQFFTAECDTPEKLKERFESMKSAAVADPTSPELLFNRGPKVVKVRSNDVLSQEFDVDAYGNKCIVFNRGDKSEASATIIAGSSATKFGQATDEALKDALQGQSRIFADGAKLLSKVNSINNAELTRWIQMRDLANACIDSIKNTIETNVKKVTEYNKAMQESSPEVDITQNGGAVAVLVK